MIDEAARRLITTDGLDATLFVEAGAGSGKTRQLVDRIVNLVVRRGVRVTSIAAITFTEAAAAELQSRIRVSFERAAVEAADPAVVERCRTAISDLDRATISTLHGFASRLLGEHTVAAHLPPRIRVLDEVSSQLAHEDRWTRFVDDLYADPANEALLILAAQIGVALEPRYRGQATFKDVADVLTQNWDRIDVVCATDPVPVTDVDFAPFDAAVAALEGIVEHCTDPSDKFYGHLTIDLLPEMLAVVAMPDPGRKLQALRALSWGPGNGGKAAAWGGDVKPYKAMVAEVVAAASAVVGSAAQVVLRNLLRLTALEVRAAAHARRDEGGLEFHDLLVLARDVLRHNESVRRELHDRYTHLLLDEFQDTDPLQIDLATLIAASVADGEPPGAWHELAVPPGRLFFVGDPKQSIYRFRRADIALYLDAGRRFGVDGGAVELVTNFRTVEPVLAWLNALFSEIMVPSDAGQAPYTPLVAHRPPSPAADHRPILLGGPHPDAKVKAGPLREAEAADVARTVADIRANSAAWPVGVEGVDDTWRPARLDDITILVPTRTSLPYLRAALEAVDVPYRLATGTLVYDTQDVHDALAVVAAVDDPTDELSLVTALRSPLYACSDVDLVTFHAAGGRWNLRTEPPAAVPVDHPVRLALAHLRSLWEERWWLGPSALLERLLRERRADLLAFGEQRPTEVWRRLRFVVDQARAFEESGGGGLRNFLEWAAMQGADGARVHEPLLAETDDDAVRIMTIHGSKGLEFPITILSGMTTRRAGKRPGVSVLWSEEGLPELKLSSHVATADHEPRADLELAMDELEKRRLLYVAATRARDHLVVACHHKAGDRADETYAGLVWNTLAERDDLWRRLDPAESATDVTDASAESNPGSEPAAPPVDDRAAFVDQRRRLLEPQRQARITSATAVAIAAAADHSPLEGDLGDADDADDVPDGTTPGDSAVVQRRRGRTGSAIGRAVHGTLEVLDFTDPTDVEAQVARQCELESIPDLEETVLAMVRSALSSPSVTEAARTRHHKEAFVAAPVGDQVIEGYIDLLIERPDGLVIVDYKTDSATSPAQIDAALARYELQGASYAVVLEAVTGRPVVDCRFVFCGVHQAVERSVVDLAGAMGRVRERLTAAP